MLTWRVVLMMAGAWASADLASGTPVLRISPVRSSPELTVLPTWSRSSWAQYHRLLSTSFFSQSSIAMI